MRIIMCIIKCCRLEALIDAITPQAVAEHVTTIISNPANLKKSPADDVKVQ